MTKTEAKIVELVRQANELGALAGLGPANDKFVLRLQEKGAIVYVQTAKLGSGWVLKENVSKFQGK